MGIVILINPNPTLPIEHWKKGQEYAEASYGVDTESLTHVEDKHGLAKVLHEIAYTLEASKA